MPNAISASRRFRLDTCGATLIEGLLVIPLLVLLTFAVIDMGLYMWQWNQAAKATHAGARIAAVVGNPVPTGLNVFTNPDDTSQVGQNCINATTGALALFNGVPLCPARTSVCTWNAGAPTCTNGWNASVAAFDRIFLTMEPFIPYLERENVQVGYSTVGLGFVDRPLPYGSPVAVTVSLRCLDMPLIWLDTFFTNPDPVACPNRDGALIPAFATTLIGEDLVTEAPFPRP